MKIRKNVLLFLLSVLLCTNLVHSQETDAVSQVALDYMNSINAGKYNEAMKFVLPGQLENFSTQAVPIFVRFIKSNNAELRNFGIQVIGDDESAWNSVDGARIFAYFLGRQDAAVKERMARTILEVADVKFSNDGKNAHVQFNATTDSHTYLLYGDLVKTEGGWFVDFGTKLDAILQQFRDIVEKSGIEQ